MFFCSTNTGQACSTYREEDGWCSTGYPGYVYDTTKNANKCVKATASGGCSADDKDDVVACCKVTTGQECSDGVIADGWCGASLVYDTKKKSNRCVSADGYDAFFCFCQTL